MIENTNSINESSPVIETAIGPLDMTEIVDGYGENEGEVTENASSDTDEANKEIEKEEAQEKKGQKDEQREEEKSTPGQEKFPLPLNVYGANVEISMEEATRAIQRGLAFDKVKSDLYEAKNDDKLLILAEIAKDTGKTGSQLLAKLHGDCLMESLEKEYGEISNVPQEELAKAVAKLSRMEGMTIQIPFKEKQLAMREQLSEFHRQNPGVSEIPEAVLEGVKSGMPLDKAYDIYRINDLEKEVRELTREITIIKQKKVAKQIEAPSLSGGASSYAMGEEDVYAFFKKMW